MRLRKRCTHRNIAQDQTGGYIALERLRPNVLKVFLVNPHLAAVEAPAPAADDGGVRRAVGTEARAAVDDLAPILAPAGTAALGVGLLRRPAGAQKKRQQMNSSPSFPRACALWLENNPALRAFTS